MTLPIHVAAVQYPSEKEDLVTSRDRAFHLMDDAAHTSDLVVLPEASFTAHLAGPKLRETAEPILGPTSAVVSEIAVRRGSFICYSIVEQDGDRIYDTGVLIGADGKMIGSQRKICLSEADLEAGFSPGDTIRIFGTHLGNIGMLICHDAQDMNNARALHRGGAQMVLVPCVAWAASQETRGDMARFWEKTLTAISRGVHSHLIWANKTGSVNGVIAVGESMIVDDQGNVVAKGTPDQEEVVRASITLSRSTLRSPAA